MKLTKRLYFNPLYESRINSFTWTNVAETERTFRCAYVPPISSGVATTSPFILKADDLVVCANITFKVVTATIDTVDDEFVIEVISLDDVLTDRRDPIENDLLHAVQYNTNTSGYDNVLSTGYYSVTKYSVTSKPYIDVLADYSIESENGYYSEQFIAYNNKTYTFASVSELKQNNFVRTGLTDLGSFQLRLTLAKAPVLVLADCDIEDGNFNKVVFDGSTTTSYINGRIQSSYNLRLVL